MTSRTSKDNHAGAPGEIASFRTHLSEVFGEQRRKGLFFRGFWRQQKEMAVSTRQAQFFNDAVRTLRSTGSIRAQPKRAETFEAAVARQGLSAEFLNAKMQRYKWLHLALYIASGAALALACWIFQTGGALTSFGVLVASMGLAINGYLQGFRAWQIENRNLIRLQDALRIPGTYLVL